MAEFRVNTNGEHNGWPAAEENPETAFLRSSFQSQFQPENRQSYNDEEILGFLSRGFDSQTLESCFSRLSVSDLSLRHQQFPLPDNRWTNRSSSLQNQGFNVVAGCGDDGYLFPPDSQQINNNDYNNQMQRFSLSSDFVNGGTFGYDTNTTSTVMMLANGLLNGNSRDVPYFSRNRFLDQSRLLDSTNGLSGINRSNIYNPNSNNLNDPSPSVESRLIVSLAKDRLSSIQMQRNILEGSKETVDMIFKDLIFHICELMVDPFGNQVLQRLMEKCSYEQINQILDMVIQNQFRFINICNDPLGTRIVQLLLRCLHSEDQILRTVEAVSLVALTLTKSNNAKNVIIQCFSLFSPLHNRTLIEIITRNCYRIAIDQHGCCMLQQCLSTGCNELKQRLIGEIIVNALRLCVNCYGNYVVQYVVELDDRNVTEDLIKTLLGNYAYLSRNKYGSHAVQKFLKIKDIDSRLIVTDLLRDIDSLLIDPYGNYVVQTAWFVSQDDIRHQLWLHIQNHSRYMRCNKFGNKILEKLQL